jgi:periplasmic protein TonB
MFADSILETSWAHRGRRSWTTLTSFGLEALLIGLLLLLPLWKTVGLPTARVVSTPISAGRFAPEPALQPGTGSASAPQFNVLPARIMQPSRVPNSIAKGNDEPASLAPIGDIGTGPDVGNLAFGAGGPLPWNISGGHPIPSIRPVTTVREFRTSKLMEGNLIRRIAPAYPPVARSARIQGSVVVSALISKAGTIENLQVLSGHPMLVASAIEAIRQWRYRPSILNSEPIEVETQITVTFSLAGN